MPSRDSGATRRDDGAMTVPEVRAPAEAHRLIGPLREAGGDSLRAILLFGSQLVRATPDGHSAWDVVLVVDSYGDFHRQLVSGGHHRRPAWLLSLLARVLPPNITAFDPGDDGPLAKCAIVSREHFQRALGPRARDHFLKGRMVQKVAVPWARDEAARAEVEEALAGARRGVLSWVAPCLAGDFDADALARRMLEVSYGGELRPESGDRVSQVHGAQAAFLHGAFQDVLDQAAQAGEVTPVGEGRFRLAREPGRWERWRVSLYFARSKVRATARWLKHVVTFNDWLTYIQRKVERRLGTTVEITPWERRLPLLLLWPKVVRVLRLRRASSPPGDDE